MTVRDNLLDLLKQGLSAEELVNSMRSYDLLQLYLAKNLAAGVFPVYPGDSISAAVAAAAAAASATSPQVVQLAPGTYTLNASVTVPPYVSILGEPGAIITGTGGSKGILLMQSHSRLSGLTVDLDTATARAVHLEQDVSNICTDVRVDGVKFINGGILGQCVVCEDLDANLSDIVVTNNQLSGIGPLKFLFTSAAHMTITNNTQNETIADTSGACAGFVDMINAFGGTSYGHVISGNHAWLHRIITSCNPNLDIYALYADGCGMLITDNSFEYSVNHVTPAAAGAAQDEYMFKISARGTVPSDELGYATKNVITNNTVNVKVTGNSTATKSRVCGFLIDDAGYSDSAMPDLVLGNNVLSYSSAQAALPKVRLAITQAYSGANNTVYLAPGGAAGFEDAADVLAYTTVTERINGRKVLYEGTISATITDTNPHKATPVAMILPAGHICRGLLITAGAPGGTAAGNKNVNYSVGSAANADDDLGDATDIDVMLASGTKTAASVHGDQASDNVAAYFPMDGVGRYIATDTTVYLNVLGQTDDATGQPKTVTAAFKVYALLENVN